MDSGWVILAWGVSNSKDQNTLVSIPGQIDLNMILVIKNFNFRKGWRRCGMVRFRVQGCRV